MTMRSINIHLFIVYTTFVEIFHILSQA